jgi:acyl-ACP thioesterase
MHLGFVHLAKENQFWVLSRLFIKWYRQPLWGESIAIRTWSLGCNKLFALRDFEITDEKGENIGAASSAWLVLNKKNKRPVRLETWFRDKVVTPHRHAVDVTLEKVSAPRNPKKHPAFKVRYSELDMVGHVNFTQYVKWILDSYTEAFIWKNTVASFEVNFIAEVSYNEALLILTEKLDSEEYNFLHSIERKGDDREVCRARVCWHPEKNSILRADLSVHRRA